MKIFLFSTGALCLKANLKKNPLLLYKWVTQWYPLHASLGIPAVLFWQELRVLVNPGTISLSELFQQFLLSHLDNVYKSTSTLFILFLKILFYLPDKCLIGTTLHFYEAKKGDTRHLLNFGLIKVIITGKKGCAYVWVCGSSYCPKPSP